MPFSRQVAVVRQITQLSLQVVKVLHRSHRGTNSVELRLSLIKPLETPLHDGFVFLSLNEAIPERRVFAPVSVQFPRLGLKLGNLRLDLAQTSLPPGSDRIEFVGLLFQFGKPGVYSDESRRPLEE